MAWMKSPEFNRICVRWNSDQRPRPAWTSTQASNTVPPTGFAQGPVRIGQGDHRAYPFAGVGVGDADDRHVGHRRQGDQQVLDLLGRDVLPLADDHVLEPPGDDQVPPVVESAQVAGAEEAVGVEGLDVEQGVEVPAHHLRSPGADLALLPRRGR